jgi:hypothetical protein
MDHVTNNNVEKVTKMCAKGLDPNYHCQDSGGGNNEWQLFGGSVSNLVLNFQYRGRYNTGISIISIPILAGIEFFSRNIPLPLKKLGNLMSKLQ